MPGVGHAAATAAVWPGNRDWLVESLVRNVPATLKSQDPESGRFGTKPWCCSDQNVLFPLAAAWACKHEKNPYYHDPHLLEAICKGGEALVRAQDEKGMWVFRKKDNSTWGKIHMPWTYSRWIRAYLLVRDDMPAASRTAWEQGLQRGFKEIRHYVDGGVHNIPTHHAMALYLAGTAFDNEEWKAAAKAFMAKVVARQDPGGFWSENYGPVVGYNMVYLDALGIYYAVSRDAGVLPALKRGAMFHANFVWDDGTPVAAIDERQIYHTERSLGNVGFSQTAVGRSFLLHQTAPLRQSGKFVPPDYAAAMLFYGGSGPAEPSAAAGDRGQFVLGKNKALMRRETPWQCCFSAYCCPVPKSRWLQDRQNFVDVFHDHLGLVVGGGNTKLQPYWSTFTVGNPGSVSHKPGDTNPNFLPRCALRWVPTRSRLVPDASPPYLDLVYHDHVGRVCAEAKSDGTFVLTYTALRYGGKRFEAHVPFLKRQGRLRFGSGKEVFLGKEAVRFLPDQIGGRFDWGGLRVVVPPGASLMWPARQFNPYKKDGASSLANAKLVLILPLKKEGESASVILGVTPGTLPEGAQVFETRDLLGSSPSGTRTRYLKKLGSFFLGASQPGDAVNFVLPVEKTGEYEVLADFVVFPGYGIVQLSLDGTPIGKAFDAYAPELDTSGPVSFGRTVLTKGQHDLLLTVVGKNRKSHRYYVSVRRFFLRPVD